MKQMRYYYRFLLIFFNRNGLGFHAWFYTCQNAVGPNFFVCIGNGSEVFLLTCYAGLVEGVLYCRFSKTGKTLTFFSSVSHTRHSICWHLYYHEYTTMVFNFSLAFVFLAL